MKPKIVCMPPFKLRVPCFLLPLAHNNNRNIYNSLHTSILAFLYWNFIPIRQTQYAKCVSCKIQRDMKKRFAIQIFRWYNFVFKNREEMRHNTRGLFVLRLRCVLLFDD